MFMIWLGEQQTNRECLVSVFLILFKTSRRAVLETIHTHTHNTKSAVDEIGGRLGAYSSIAYHHHHHQHIHNSFGFTVVASRWCVVRIVRLICDTDKKTCASHERLHANVRIMKRTHEFVERTDIR